MRGTKRNRVPPPHFLRAWRKERALSQEALAEYADTTHGTISRLETGAMNLNQDLAVRLAAALRIELGDLYRPPAENGGSSIHDKIARLSPDQREIAERLIDALHADPAIKKIGR